MQTSEDQGMIGTHDSKQESSLLLTQFPWPTSPHVDSPAEQGELVPITGQSQK
jgi:hypothetical protein